MSRTPPNQPLPPTKSAAERRALGGMSRNASMIAATLLGALYGGASAAAWKISDAAAPMDGRGLNAAAAVYAVLGVGWISVGFLRPTWNTSWPVLAVAALTAVEIGWGWTKDESSPMHALETLIVLSLVGVVVTSRLARADGPTKPVQPTRACGPRGAHEDQAVLGLMAATRPKKRYLLCVRNKGCEDLELRKLYEQLADPRASEERKGYVRVVDESGEDYLYPSDFFVAVDLPREAERALAGAVR